MADEFKKKKKKKPAEQDFHLQFSIQPGGASDGSPPLADNRLQPVSVIALPVTNIKQLLQAERDLKRDRDGERQTGEEGGETDGDKAGEMNIYDLQVLMGK